LSVDRRPHETDRPRARRVLPRHRESHRHQGRSHDAGGRPPRPPAHAQPELRARQDHAHHALRRRQGALPAAGAHPRRRGQRVQAVRRLAV
ncbi:hypothetical protein BN1723_019409, partial [Verticillium longisporum]